MQLFLERRARLLPILLGIAAWGAALVGSLQLHRLEGLIGHSICGRWGCAAKPEALLGYHLFLLLLMAPTLTLVCRWLGPCARRALAKSLVVLGLLGVVLLAGGAAVQWRRTASDDLQRYTLHRAAFTVATTPDLPVTQIALSGLSCLLFGGASPRGSSACRTDV